VRVSLLPEERGRLLDGIFEMYPEWYLFFYLTTRLGLRRGEVHAISKDRARDIPPQLILDRAVQEGKGDRPAQLGHHKIGRHSVASQAATAGRSIKAIQAQLGRQSAQSTHQYAHLGARAQLRLVQALAPSSPPHVNVRSTSTGGADGRTAQGAGAHTETGNRT